MTTELLQRGTVTPRQATAEYGLSRSRIFQLIQDGTLPKVQLSARKILIPRASIESFLAKYLAGQPTKSA